MYGVPSNKYYTFGIQAYRNVDPDINASGVIVSSIVQPTIGPEHPYRPSASIAFSGALSGTVSDISNHDADALAESVSRKWAGESGADVTVEHVSGTAVNLCNPNYSAFR